MSEKPPKVKSSIAGESDITPSEYASRGGKAAAKKLREATLRKWFKSQSLDKEMIERAINTNEDLVPIDPEDPGPHLGRFDGEERPR